MKIMRWFFLVSVILMCGACLTIRHIGGELWVAQDGFPDALQPDTLYTLYTFLQSQVQAHEDSPLAAPAGDAPVVLRFVGDGAGRAFPDSAEGFAGLTGYAAWRCGPLLPGETAFCQLSAERRGLERVIVVVVDGGLEAKEMTGVVAHELAHALGAVDGPRCPAHEDYDPLARLGVDQSDSYWWYGAVGVFSYRPQGIVWAALNGGCAGCDAPEICRALEAILAGESPPG